MTTLRLAAFVLAGCLPALALAQYSWIDKDGRRVFSDRPPPSDVPAARVTGQQRAVAPAAAPVPATPASAAASAASAPKVTGRDPALEQKKKQAEAAEAAKKKEEAEKMAAARADNCKRARESKAAFDSGMRLSRVNDKGERVVMEDKERAEELARIEGIIARDCAQAQ